MVDKETMDAAELQVDLIIANAHLEERCLRFIDDLVQRLPESAFTTAEGLTSIQMARRHVQQAFMWSQRAITAPPRMRLPEDVTDV